MTCKGNYDCVELIKCKTATELLEYLRPTHDIWYGPINSWIFRGHSRSKWKLIPSVFRNDTIISYREKKKVSDISDTHSAEFIKYEAGLLLDFINESDKIGLKIPGDSFSIRGNLEEATMQGSFRKPYIKIMEIIAIAQHHGVPTRLLDFSNNALKAGYFACIDAYSEMRHLELIKENIKYLKNWEERKEEGDFSICVWAINKEFIKKCFISIIKVPSHDNDFLYAQEGLFLYKYDIENSEILVGLKKEHELFLQNTNDFLKLINYYYNNEENKPIKKLTLSISENMINELNKCPDHLDNEEIVKFLKLLMKENITKSSLMPTFEMVVENLKMRGHLKEWWEN